MTSKSTRVERSAGGRHGQGPFEQRLRGKQVVIALGAGGVGKTTSAAALGLGLALRGRRVAVVTIDPARRLASSLGLDGLSGEPTRIGLGALEAQGKPVAGELWAMMLDTKRTFDQVVTRLAPDERTLQEILENPIYAQLSTAVSGSQELSAVVKLHELHAEGGFDVIVLDTPPSRHALDFLETPGRLLGFLEGRALQVFLAPGGMTARLFGRGTALVFSIFARVTGVDMLSDLSTFFRALSGVLAGFGERTRGVERLLRAPETAFIVVTSPEAEPAREAAFLAHRLERAGLAAPELIVNRVHLDGLGEATAEQAQALLCDALGERLGGRVARNLADFDTLARRDRETVSRLSAALGTEQPVLVGHLDEEVQDLLGLARVAEQLFL
ncbi:MAG: ArsA family ATPase [Solirubrobacteraceae bacterium]